MGASPHIISLFHTQYLNKKLLKKPLLDMESSHESGLKTLEPIRLWDFRSRQLILFPDMQIRLTRSGLQYADPAYILVFAVDVIASLIT